MRAADNVADREAHDEAARDEVVYDPRDEAEVVDDTSQEAEVVDDTSQSAEPVVDDAGVIEPVATEQPETEPSHDGVVGLWPVADAEAIRERWREVQLRFVDDPGTAADEAGKLVDDAARVLVTTIESRRSELGGWRDNPTGDTEQLRLVVQGYREFMDQVPGV